MWCCLYTYSTKSKLTHHTTQPTSSASYGWGEGLQPTMGGRVKSQVWLGELSASYWRSAGNNLAGGPLGFEGTIISFPYVPHTIYYNVISTVALYNLFSKKFVKLPQVELDYGHVNSSFGVSFVMLGNIYGKKVFISPITDF